MTQFVLERFPWPSFEEWRRKRGWELEDHRGVCQDSECDITRLAPKKGQRVEGWQGTDEEVLGKRINSDW